MTRDEYFRAVSNKTGVTKKDIAFISDAMRDVIVEAVNNHDVARVFEGVAFVGEEVAERSYRNPHTGGSVVVPKHTGVKVKISNGFKKLIKNE